MSVSLCMYTCHRAQEEAREQPRVSVLAFYPSCNRILFTAAWMSIWITSFHLGTGKLGLEQWHPAVRWFRRPSLRPSCLHSEYLTPETPPLTLGEPPLLTSASPMTSCCYVEKKASRKIYCLWLYSHYSFQMISFSFFLSLMFWFSKIMDLWCEVKHTCEVSSRIHLLIERNGLKWERTSFWGRCAIYRDNRCVTRHGHGGCVNWCLKHREK